MSFVNTIAPPKLAWQFEGTTTPYIGSVSSRTQRGTLNYTTPGKYTSSLNIQNPAGSTSNSVNWNIGTATYSIDAGFSFAFWIRFNDLSYTASIQQFITFYNAGGNPLRFQLSSPGELMQFQFTDSVGQKNTNMFFPVAAVWYHLALVGSAGNITAYLNGSTTYGPMAYVQTGITFNTAFLGVTASTSNPVTNADFDDLRIFDRVLTAAEIRAVYNEGGMPGLGALATQGMPPTRLTGTPLFSQISAAATSSAVGAFSLRAVNGTTARAVNVRNGTTSATQDFYADRLGNLLTAPVTGKPLATWLGGATGYVTTWYDQSGKGNHATQATTANQPIIQRATKGPGYACVYTGNQWVSFGTLSTFTGVPFCISAVTTRTSNIAYNGIIGWGTTASGFTFSIEPLSATQDRLRSDFRKTTNLNSFGSIPVYTLSEGVLYPVCDYSSEFINRIYNNASLLTTSGNGVDFLNNAITYIPSIGLSNARAPSNYYKGEIYELLVFTQSLYDLDNTGGLVTQIYQNQLGYTGA